MWPTFTGMKLLHTHKASLDCSDKYLGQDLKLMQFYLQAFSKVQITFVKFEILFFFSTQCSKHLKGGTGI